MLGPFHVLTMPLHPRTKLVEAAQNDIRLFILEVQSKRGLTFHEILKILGEEITNVSKYAIRDERHPDNPNKKGDEA